MSKHNSKILKIYQQCDQVLNLKRNFVSNIQIPPIPTISKQSYSSNIKQFCSAYYIKVAVTKLFQESTEIYSEYQTLFPDSDSKLINNNIKRNINKIKNTKELTSKHEQLESQLDEMKSSWENKNRNNENIDPLVEYEINETLKLKKAVGEKFSSYREGQNGLKTAKNPHFVHQIISQLKENLEEVSYQDKKSDQKYEETNQKVSKYLKDLTKEMQNGINEIYFHSYIFEQKKKLFSQFVEYPETKGSKFKSNNITKHYFEQLFLVSKDIKAHFHRTIQFVDDLIGFLNALQQFLKVQCKKVDKNYQDFLEEVHRNKEISILLRVDIQERINNNLKAIFSINQILQSLPEWLVECRKALVECYSEAKNYHERYVTKEMKYSEMDSFQKILIEHKGYFSNLERSKAFVDLQPYRFQRKKRLIR